MGELACGACGGPAHFETHGGETWIVCNDATPGRSCHHKQKASAPASPPGEASAPPQWEHMPLAATKHGPWIDYGPDAKAVTCWRCGRHRDFAHEPCVPLPGWARPATVANLERVERAESELQREKAARDAERVQIGAEAAEMAERLEAAEQRLQTSLDATALWLGRCAAAEQRLREVEGDIKAMLDGLPFENLLSASLAVRRAWKRIEQARSLSPSTAEPTSK